jgi:hypothetical protein
MKFRQASNDIEEALSQALLVQKEDVRSKIPYVRIRPFATVQANSPKDRKVRTAVARRAHSEGPVLPGPALEATLGE